MNFIKTHIEGVFIIEPQIFEDSRGYFFEAYNQVEFDNNIRPIHFVQDNESKSSYGVLRGVHFQSGTHAQSKLARVVKGRVYDVAVDVRIGSPTFGKYIGVELSDENHRMLFIPKGFAHGFSVLSDEAIFQYKVDNFYCPNSERAFAWNDKEININWHLPIEDIKVLDKDNHYPLLKDVADLFDYHIDLYSNGR